VDFISKRYVWFTISGVAVAISLLFLVFSGFNLGVDFTGGTLLQIAFENEPSVQQVKDTLISGELDHLQLAKSFVQKSENKILIRSRELNNADKDEVFGVLRVKFGEFQDLGTQTVGPTVGRELYVNALKALIVASVLIIGYISIRFELTSGVTAVLALLHDVLIVLGIFSIFKIEINSPFIAAILTVIGYSINDTIVIFDRIRENQKFSKREPLAEVVNKSINQSLIRSFNTSITTFTVVAALFIFGASVIKGFSLAMLIGVVVGTYSSIFIASPLWVEWKLRERKAG
jgi:preprotein translocase subunit SecF